MLHYICAFKAEAQPLIEHYEMKHQGDTGLFSLYLDKDKETSVTISGLGKLAASSALIHTHMDLQCGPGDIWINLGIAGHREHEVGTLFLCDCVEDAGSGQTWYPQVLVDTSIPAAALLTLDRPSDEYTVQMYDMEASGVFHAACRITTLEFIHALKVISDNQDRSLQQVDRNEIYNLVAARTGEICKFADSLKILSKQIPPRIDTQEHKELFSSAAHFTSSQESQLVSLLRRYSILFPGENPAKLVKNEHDAASLLRKLREHMDKAPFTLEK